MKISKSKLKEIIKEEIGSNEALIDAIFALSDKIEDLDVSIDYLAGAVTDQDPYSIGYSQATSGRLAKPTKGKMKEGVENINSESLMALFKALEHFATDPAIVSTLGTGGLLGAVKAMKDKFMPKEPEDQEQVEEGIFDRPMGKVKDMAARVTGPRHTLGGDETKEAWEAIGGFLNTRSDEQIKQFHEKARISIPLEKFAANLRRAVEYGEEKFKIYSLSDALDAGYNSRKGRGRPKGRLREKELTPPEKKEKEKVVKGMKKSKEGFEKRYGDDAESVMYATATKIAKEKA